MSLEALRAQAEAEEKEVAEVEESETQDEPEEEEAEADAEEGSSEEEGDETEEAEESDDFELELDGEPEPGQQKPSPEQALIYKLTKEKGKKREYKDRVDELEAELAELRGQVSGKAQPRPQSEPQQQEEPLPPVPVLYENGINTNEQFQAAFQKWHQEVEAVKQRNAERKRSQSAHVKQLEDMSLDVAKRVAKFATEHKMSSDYVAGAVQKATQEIESATGIEGSFAYLLSKVGEGSEKAAIWIGTEKGAADLQRIQKSLQDDPSGLEAMGMLTRIASRKPASKRTSKAPDPDRPIKGDGSSASAKSIQDKYDKCKDPQEMMRLRKKARELGVKLT